jgi:hypothetical protein
MEEKKYAVFLSYKGDDRETVQKIAIHLADKANLQPWFDDWSLIPGEPWVRHLQRGLDASSTCAVFVGKSGEGPWQQAEVERALQNQMSNHDFRVIPVLLPDAPRKRPELPSFLASNTWVCFEGNIEDDNALWRLECGIKGEAPGRGRPADAPLPVNTGPAQPTPQPRLDPQHLIVPGKTLEVGSRFYIARHTDEAVFRVLSNPLAMVTVLGARQTGKTSLILRVYADINRLGNQIRPILIDFQNISYKEFESVSLIWRAIAEEIARQLQLPGWSTSDWELDLSHDINFSNFLDHFVFEESESPLLMCLDNVDILFHWPIKSDFFASMRAFYNRAVTDPAWGKVQWLLGTSSEPSFFISDLTRSPFNIGLRIELSNLTPKEVESFAARHGLNLDQHNVQRVMDYLGGHPYLVHLLLYHLVRNPMFSDQHFNANTAGGGIFKEHLYRYMTEFESDKELADAMKKVIAGQSINELKMVARLEAAGLVQRDENQNIRPRCGLYAEFFRAKLK